MSPRHKNQLGIQIFLLEKVNHFTTAKGKKMKDQENASQEFPFPTEGEQTYYFSDSFQSYYSGKESIYTNQEFYNMTGKLVVSISNNTLKL